MEASELDFDLPPELIAQTPPAQRRGSRLLHYRRQSGEIVHRQFSDLPSLLRKGDLLVLNNARVLPARFLLQKQTGGRIEALFLEELAPGRWRVLLKNVGAAPVGTKLSFVAATHIELSLCQRGQEGEWTVDVSDPSPAAYLLQQIGRMPLPPYIKRNKESDERDDMDRARYQTVFASTPGAVAAPTAGLHFDDTTFGQLDVIGVQRAFVTLHVGLGTFKPLSADRLEDHVMHVERYEISPETADALTRAKQDGRRIIAIGTTAARVLESQPAGDWFEAKSGETGIFIYPPYEWKHVGAMVTNFHLPRSTLIALVAAMAGLDEQRRIYRKAIEQKYRFFSYGDAMFIE